MKKISSHLLLKKIHCNTITQSELKNLIEYSFNIATTFLRNHYKSKINYKIFSQHSIEDLAIDAIVPLFIKNKSGVLGLKRALDNWDDPIENDSDSDFFISKLIWKRADQTLTNLLKERDPIFDKILKTLNLCVSNSSLKKLRYFGTVYIVENNLESLDGNLLKYESFSKIPAHLFTYKQIVLFERLFEYIKKETQFTPAIPLNLLVKRIKKIHLQKHEEFLTDYIEEDNKFIYKDIVAEGLSSIKERLDTFYLPNARLDCDDAELIMSSFNDISKDMLNGGMNGSLYDYLKFRKSSLTADQFYSKYHSIMNTLLKNFRNKISEMVK